jgi:AcrR family transcriptional regulator
MSPRAYKLGERQAATEETRARIIAAARELLTAPDGIAGFTLDAVARQAGVARMTVYYQFGSKVGLLEKLYDDLAEKGLVPRLQTVFIQKDGVAALGALIDAFSGFWASEQLVTRRLRALARLDPEVELGIQRRDSWRRQHLHNALARAAQDNEAIAMALNSETEDVIYSLTSFEYFDALAGLRDAETASGLVKRLAFQVLGLHTFT